MIKAGEQERRARKESDSARKIPRELLVAGFAQSERLNPRKSLKAHSDESCNSLDP